MMFKKLTLVALVITSSYAMENNKISLNCNIDGNNIQTNNIQLNTNEVKNNISSDIQQSCVYTHVNNSVIETKKNTQPNNEKVVNIDDYAITKSKPFKTMTPDEKDWARLRIYDRFSKSCQNFIQMAFRKKNIDKRMTDFFYKTHVIRFCILTGLEPQQIFLNELKYNISSECYNSQPNHVRQKFDEITHFLPRLTEGYRALFIKKGYVDNFDM